MKTENLIQMIASDSLRDLRPSFKSQLLKLIFIGGLVSFTLMVLIFNFRPDFFQALKLPFFWIKPRAGTTICSNTWKCFCQRTT
jgi:hypothetical protein